MLSDEFKQSIREEQIVPQIPYLAIGQTNREEVLLTLGEPDEASSDGRRFVYRWSKLKFLAVIPVGYIGGSVSAKKQYQLIITFDNQGVVSGCELKDELQWGP